LRYRNKIDRRLNGSAGSKLEQMRGGGSAAWRGL
jgi:hypothetical protein